MAKNGKIKPASATSNGPATTKEIAALEPIRISAEKIDLTPDLVRKYIAKGASAEDLFWFMGTARSLGLDPLRREIHWVPFGSGGTTVVGYQVYLKRAEATGFLDGWELDYGRDSEGEFCEITIYRKDWDHPFKWKTYRDEVDTGSPIWKKRGRFMHGKCTIGQGFRLCFPNDVGVLPYLPEEVDVPNGFLPQPSPVIDSKPVIAQEAEYVDVRSEPPEVEKIPHDMSETRKAYFAAMNGIFKTDEERKSWQKVVTGKSSTDDWNAADYAKAFNALSDLVAKKESKETESLKTDEQDLDSLSSECAKKLKVDWSSFMEWTTSHFEDVDDAMNVLFKALQSDQVLAGIKKQYDEWLKGQEPETSEEQPELGV